MKRWKNLDSTARKWIRGWVLVMDGKLNQKIVWHDQISDDDLFYYTIPQSLLMSQFKKTDAFRDIHQENKKGK